MFILSAITASHFSATLFPLRFKVEVGDSSKARWQKSPTAAEPRFAPSSSHFCIANCPVPSLPITAPLDLQNENQSYGGIAYQAISFHQLSGWGCCLSDSHLTPPAPLLSHTHTPHAVINRVNFSLRIYILPVNTCLLLPCHPHFTVTTL